MRLDEFEASVINILMIAISAVPDSKIKLDIKSVDDSLKNPGYNLVSYEQNSNIVRIWPYNRTCIAYKNLKENNFTDLGFLQELLDILTVLTGPYSKLYEEVIMSLLESQN